MTDGVAGARVREELREEYFKVIDILQMYDPYFLTIKNWGVTASGVAASVGLANKTAVAFLLASLIAFGFWLTEVRFKLLQLAHARRAAELEAALRHQHSDEAAPRILEAFGEQSQILRHTRRWKAVMFWPQVMLPHAVLVAGGVVGFLIAQLLW